MQGGDVQSGALGVAETNGLVVGIKLLRSLYNCSYLSLPVAGKHPILAYSMRGSMNAFQQIVVVVNFQRRYSDQ
jgi:hypothetical protein